MITPETLSAKGTEHGHQSALFCWAQQNNKYMYEHLFAIPNGGQRGAATAAMLKGEGVKRGVPDVMLAITTPVYAGLFIEMKKPADRATKKRKGVTSDHQDLWHVRLVRQRYAVAVCYTWQEARDVIINYLDGKAIVYLFDMP